MEGRLNTQMEFEQAVDRWVRDAILRTSAFESLLCSLPGVFPSEVVNSLRRLRQTSVVAIELLDRLLRESTEPLPTKINSLFKFHLCIQSAFHAPLRLRL